MSALRQFLRYEISGLMMLIASCLLVLGFSNFEMYYIDNYLEYLKHLVGFVVVISLAIGWLAYQIFEELAQPHTKTKSFQEVKRIFEENNSYLTKRQYIPLIDFCLKDVYKKYPYLPNVLGGFWDNYYARCVVGWGVLLSSLITLIIIPRFIHQSVYTALIILVIMILLFFLLIIYLGESNEVSQTKEDRSESIRNSTLCNIQFLIIIFTLLALYFLFILYKFNEMLNIIIVGIYLLYLGFIVFICIRSSRIRDEVGTLEFFFIKYELKNGCGKKTCIEEISKSISEGSSTRSQK